MNHSRGWREAGPDMLSMLYRVTMARAGHEAALDAFKRLAFPVRILVAADDAVAGEPLAPPLMPRETTRTRRLPTESQLLGESLEALAAADLPWHLVDAAVCVKIDPVLVRSYFE